MGTTIYAKSTISRLPIELCIYVPTFDSFYLWIRSKVWPNCVMLQLLEGVHCRSGRSKMPTWRKFGLMRAHSPHQYIVLAQIWYEVAHWWKVSRDCCKDWCFYGYRSLVEVDARFRGLLIRNSNVGTERQSTTTTQWKGHHLAFLDISERPLCS